MNFKIDTASKIISISEAVNISQLVKVLKSWLPNGAWKKYEIRAETFLFSNPIVIQRPFWYETPPSIFTPYVTTVDSGMMSVEATLTTTNFCVSLEE